MDWSSAIPALVVTLREGVEATLAVGIVLAYLNRVEKQFLYRWVFWGVGAGVVGSIAVGLVLRLAVNWAMAVKPDYAAAIEPLLEGAIGIAAIVLLSWMLVWMARQAKRLKGKTERAVEAVLDRDRGAAWGLASLAGVAVLREGVELVLFLMAQVQRGWMSLLGSGLGLSGAVTIGLLIFRWGVRIDLGRFFKIVGLLLLAIVAGLVVSAIGDLDEATMAFDRLWSGMDVCQQLNFGNQPEVCWLGPQLWDLSDTLPQRQFPGVILRSLFGYAERLYWVQAIAYASFWAIVGGSYARTLGPEQPKKEIRDEPPLAKPNASQIEQ